MNYPGGIQSKKIKQFSYSNRGMKLEAEINLSNDFYLEKGIACIHKKPTPIKVLDVDYKEANDCLIKKACFEKKSTLDYNGIYKGKYIDFEAKETKNSSSFPLSNIHEHQINHIKTIIKMGGICFLIIRFTTRNLTFYLEGSKLISFIENNDRKSIPLSFFESDCLQIKDSINPRVDYIKIIDELYFKEV